MKIMLDAGHYGKYNRSPCVPSYYESEAMWKLHVKLKNALESYGITVGTTREDQAKDLEVTARGKKAKGYDLFLSLHSNAVGSSANESIDYPVCYVPLNGKGDVIGKKLADTVRDTMATTQAGRTNTRALDDGKTDYYGVIRGSVSVGATGIIIEHSFHTQTRATNWLLSESNLQKLAEAEAATIAGHYGIKKPAPGTSQDQPGTGKQDKEDDTVTQEQFHKMMDTWLNSSPSTLQRLFNGCMNAWEEANNPTYNTLEDVPDYWREEVRALLNAGHIKGDGVHEIGMKRETLRSVIVAGRMAGVGR